MRRRLTSALRWSHTALAALGYRGPAPRAGTGDGLIHKFSTSAMHRWSRGTYKVQVVVAGSDRPVAFCDGTDEDIEELRSIAREEGTELAAVHKRVLKTGREIWTIGEPHARRAPTDED